VLLYLAGSVQHVDPVGEMRPGFHHFAAASACRPALVIFMYAISIVRLPAIARWVCAVASPVRTSSSICGAVKPCAIMIASVQPSRLEASNSSARCLGGGRLRLRLRLATILLPN
jgi:hypothetical protein